MTVRSDSQSGEAESTPTAEAAESVSGYRNLARIGHGGFSVVYRAVQESFERDVALKVLTVGTDEDSQRRFMREVRLASKLSGHPHVVTVLDTGTTAAGRPYLAMDLYDGGSMKDRLKRTGPLDATEVAMVGAKIAEALAAAHTLGVLHRDVKPNNILVSRFGEPALADFGVSCLLDSNTSASVLIMWRAMSEPAPRPDCPELPGLADAVVRAMAKEPEERFPDAADFARTLRALIPDGASSTLATTVLAPIAAAAPVASASAATSILAADPDTGAHSASVTGPGLDPDDTSGGRLHGVDETMVRPDRVDLEPAPKSKRKRGGGAGAGAAGGGVGVVGTAGDGDREGRRRGRTPLIALIALCLLGAAVWVVLDTQNSSTGPKAEASSHTVLTVTASASASRSASAKPSPSATHTATHSATPTAVQTTHTATPSARASSSNSATSSSGGGLLGIGTYYQFKNLQSGNCLTASGSSAGQQSCGAGSSQGWQFTEPVTGILNSLAGDFELVNKATGDCLVASGGSVSTATCDGSTAQLWSTVSESSGKEVHSAGDSLCLTSSGSGVTTGTCSSSSSADLWSQS